MKRDQLILDTVVGSQPCNIVDSTESQRLCNSRILPLQVLVVEAIKEWRIRNDQPPTPQAVTVCDLDLRNLYRNQLLTALDDVTAEV